MRLFIALDIDDAIRERIARFVEGLRNFAPDARWAHPESLHVTLKFIGEQPDGAVEKIKQTLTEIVANPIDIQFRGYGFFPTAKSARVFWMGMAAGPELAKLAADIDSKMAALGIPKEERVFSPHLTLARAGGGSGSPRWREEDRPNRILRLLQERLSALPTPEFGTMTSREFFLYRSQLSPKGSKYTKLARFTLSQDR
jgi:RNA 2',3'-cyclic 3'-phosphodiesterase